MKKQVSYTLSEEALELLEKIARKLGVSKTAVLEMVIRQKAREENVKWPVGYIE